MSRLLTILFTLNTLLNSSYSKTGRIHYELSKVNVLNTKIGDQALKAKGLHCISFCHHLKTLMKSGLISPKRFLSSLILTKLNFQYDNLTWSKRVNERCLSAISSTFDFDSYSPIKICHNNWIVGLISHKSVHFTILKPSCYRSFTLSQSYKPTESGLH